MMKILAGFLLGAVGGIAGFYLVESSGGDAPTDTESSRVAALEKELGASRDRNKRLTKLNETLQKEVTDARESVPIEVAEVTPIAVDETPVEKKGLAEQSPFIAMMMAMGAEQARKGADKAVDELAERLSMTDNQRQRAVEAMEAMLQARQTAGMKVMSGKATFAELFASDDKNFYAFDEAMTDILGENQREEFAEFQREREIERIENKTEEDMGGLQNVGLSDDQMASARDLFSELNANTPPPNPRDMEGMSMNDFNDYLDGEINTRVDGLRPILNEEQMGSYQENVEGFRRMITGIVAAGTGNQVPAADVAE